MERPLLTTSITAETFRDFYYLKEELVTFCREEKLQTTGNKELLTQRIAHYLETGEKLTTSKTKTKNKNITEITINSLIETPFVCSEIHRQFFKQQIGNHFSFNVGFQTWLKTNSGKTYASAINAYHKILADKKKNGTQIDKQFEYNTYIRDFFADNKDKSLQDAIQCWKHKKVLVGHNRYEKTDLQVL